MSLWSEQLEENVHHIYDGNEDNRLETIRIWRIKIQKLGIKRFISKGYVWDGNDDTIQLAVLVLSSPGHTRFTE